MLFQPPFGDVDDRIRAIANALGLRTIIWQYDSNDWKAGTGNITKATVHGNYQALINMSANGVFDSVIILSGRSKPNCDLTGRIGWRYYVDA
jgi:peptidoglycan/xylan/chitin deacetylase (PgdA/CDA1 family)